MEKYSSIRLEITSKCNLKCSYCHNAKYANNAEDLSTEEILKLIRNLKSYYPINKILLTGGEPLCQPDLVKIVQEITNLKIKPDMVSNGTLLNKNFIKELDNAGLKRIRLSIDEIGNKSKIRGTSSPKDLWLKVKEIQENSNIEVCIHSVCSPNNVNILDKLYKQVVASGAKRWRVFDIGYQGGFANEYKNYNLVRYYKTYIKKARAILKSYIKNEVYKKLDIEISNIFRTDFLKLSQEDIDTLNLQKELEIKLKSNPCDYVKGHQLTIRSDGKASLCQYYRNCIFDYKKNSFDIAKTVKNKQPCTENDMFVKNVPYCKNCKYILMCSCGCRSRAEFFTHNIYEADPIACYLSKEVDKKIMPLLPSNIKNYYNAIKIQSGTEPKYNYKDVKTFLRSQK